MPDLFLHLMGRRHPDPLRGDAPCELSAHEEAIPADDGGRRRRRRRGAGGHSGSGALTFLMIHRFMWYFRSASTLQLMHSPWRPPWQRGTRGLID